MANRGLAYRGARRQWRERGELLQPNAAAASAGVQPWQQKEMHRKRRTERQKREKERAQKEERKQNGRETSEAMHMKAVSQPHCQYFSLGSNLFFCSLDILFLSFTAKNKDSRYTPLVQREGQPFDSEPAGAFTPSAGHPSHTKHTPLLFGFCIPWAHQYNHHNVVVCKVIFRLRGGAEETTRKAIVTSRGTQQWRRRYALFLFAPAGRRESQEARGVLRKTVIRRPGESQVALGGEGEHTLSSRVR